MGFPLQSLRDGIQTRGEMMVNSSYHLKLRGKGFLPHFAQTTGQFEGYVA
jgi:hypothetical protein